MTMITGTSPKVSKQSKRIADFENVKLLHLQYYDIHIELFIPTLLCSPLEILFQINSHTSQLAPPFFMKKFFSMVFY